MPRRRKYDFLERILFPDALIESPIIRRRKRRSRKAPSQRADPTRDTLSKLLRGVDEDIERIFLNLPPDKLAKVFKRYGEAYGAGKVSYAKSTYPNWKSGQVQMGGQIAERLLNLVPVALDADTQFDLVKKLRSAYMRKETRHVTCAAAEWRKHVGPVVNELAGRSNKFQLPKEVLERVSWLTEGNATITQRLLAKAERDETKIRVQHLDHEFRRIDALVEHLETTESVIQTIEIPQGTVVVTIKVPDRGIMRVLKNIAAAFGIG